MDLQNEMKAMIAKLRNGEIEKFCCKKEEFNTFRELLMVQEDKEKFRGEAKKGGEVIYTYNTLGE